MGKRLLTTPRSKVRAALRQLSLRSRERAAAMKAAHYCCEICGVKKSVARGREIAVEAHHRDGVDWDDLINIVFERLLVPPEKWQCLCEKCHQRITDEKILEVTGI